MIDAYLDPRPLDEGAAHHADLAASALRHRYRESGLRPSKRYGQHFLADLNLARRIVAELGPPGEPVIEIGAGLGALTFPLVGAGHRGIAIEIDRRLAGWLSEALAPWPDLKVVQADVRTLDLRALAMPGGAAGERWRVVGNLPYLLTSEILLKLTRDAEAFTTAVIMVQEDVAQRLLAQPGSRTYGSLTVTLSLRFSIESVLRAPRQAFWPAPEVDSAVIRLTPHPIPHIADADWVERIVRAAFAQRRKTLGKGLASSLRAPRPAVEAALKRVGIDPARRAETVSPEDFLSLAGELKSLAAQLA